MFTRTTKSSYRKEKKMKSTTNTNTNRTRYTISQQDAANFLCEADPNLGNYVEVKKNQKGDIEHHVKGLDGQIIIQVKSYKIVARLVHPDFPRVEDTILSVKRFFSSKSLMVAARELRAQIQTLMDKVAASKAKTQKKAEKPAKQQKNDAAEKTPAPVKTGTVEKKHGKNRLGHIYGTIADELDNLFLSNVTEEELLKAGYAPVRIKSHFRHLLKDKASLVDVKFENGQYFAKYID